jgi:hypothetical protein
MSVAMQRLENGTRQADRRREAARLAALAAYDVLDTPPERCYDDLTRLAAEYFQADAACLGFADESRVWIKSWWGQHVRELPRANSVFDLVLEEGGLVVVSDVNCQCACGKPLLVRILAGLTAPKPQTGDRWADDILAEDVATISYEQALRTHTRYRRPDPLPAPLEDADPQRPSRRNPSASPSGFPKS